MEKANYNKTKGRRRRMKASRPHRQNKAPASEPGFAPKDRRYILMNPFYSHNSSIAHTGTVVKGVRTWQYVFRV